MTYEREMREGYTVIVIASVRTVLSATWGEK